MAAVADDRIVIPFNQKVEEDRRAAIAEESEAVRADMRKPLDWAALHDQTPPVRDWIIKGWLGRGHVTLMAGPPGAGKTALSQTIASGICMGRHVIDEVGEPTNALFWAGEDDKNELWRRQISIAQWLGEPLTAFQDRLILQAYPDRDITLAAPADGILVQTGLMKELREQIGDYKAGVVFLDSIAKVYGGNENDRHQVTQFMSWLTWALEPTNAAICLLGHPAKATGSEFSGSTAWEASARARLYFGYRKPDEPEPEDDIEPDDDTRWLCKRKTNYSQRDIREVRWQDGCMQPAMAIDEQGARGRSTAFLTDEACRILRQLREMNVPTVPKKGPGYFPRVAIDQRLSGTLTANELKTGLAEAMKSGRIVIGAVGKYANRTDRLGLTLP